MVLGARAVENAIFRGELRSRTGEAKDVSSRAYFKL